MMEYRLGGGKRTVTFTGELIAQADSRATGKRRWAKVALYRTDSGKFVATGCGCSTVPGELMRCWAEECDDLDAARECFTIKKPQGPTVPLASRQVLEEAARLLGEENRSVRPT